MSTIALIERIDTNRTVHNLSSAIRLLRAWTISKTCGSQRIFQNAKSPLRANSGQGLFNHFLVNVEGRRLMTTAQPLSRLVMQSSGSLFTETSGDGHLIVRLSSPSRVCSRIGILGCTSSTLTPVSNGRSLTRQWRPRRAVPPARPLGRNLEERPRLFGTTLHEIGIAIVAVAVTMVIWFYASSLGFTPN
jgi:hypothetical protein